MTSWDKKSLASRGGAMPSLSTVKTFSQGISAAPMLGPGSCLSYGGSAAATKSMGISGSQNGGTVPYKALFCWDIPLHRPYIGLIYSRYLHFRILKFPLTKGYDGYGWIWNHTGCWCSLIFKWETRLVPCDTMWLPTSLVVAGGT